MSNPTGPASTASAITKKMGKGARVGMVHKESPAVRVSVWIMVVATISLIAGLQFFLSDMDDNTMSRQGEVADATMALISIHRAATQAGVLQVNTADPAKLSAWIQGQTGANAAVPDLSAAGLYPKGARMLRMAQSDWPLIQYVDRTGQLAEIFLAAAPTGEVLAPKESVEEEVAGTTAYFDRVHGVGVVYLTIGTTDWMLVSVENDTVHRSLVTMLVDVLG
jgi:hypothetical protein